MAQSRSTTPARGATPARGIAAGLGRQRGTTPSAGIAHRPITTSAMKRTNTSVTNKSRPRLLGGISAPNPPPNYPKFQSPKLSSPKKFESTRVTRQRDGTLPGAPERLIAESALVAQEQRKKMTKNGAKTGAGVKKAALKGPGISTTESSLPAKTTSAARKTMKSPAKSSAMKGARNKKKVVTTKKATPKKSKR